MKNYPRVFYSRERNQLFVVYKNKRGDIYSMPWMILGLRENRYIYLLNLNILKRLECEDFGEL